MRHLKQALWVGLATGLLLPSCIQAAAAAALKTPGQPELAITQLNVTGDEFVTLQNIGTAPAQLADYWLGYTSDETATAVPTQQLPDASLAAGSVVVLSKEAVTTCGAQYVDTLHVSLSNSGGRLALWQFSDTEDGSHFDFLWSLSWSKSGTTDLGHLNLKDEAVVDEYSEQQAITPMPQPMWFRTIEGENGWQTGFMSECTFTPVTAPDESAVAQPVRWKSDGSGPPYVLGASVSPKGAEQPHIPVSDRGLKALDLSELLPNPGSPKTDADDEFIELYNPNNKPFDLSGFMLQTASVSSSASHIYKFKQGTTIAPHSFRAFTSATTHLSLSNSGGQVWLVDPLGTTVTKSDAYGKAKDDYAWINAAGKWQWSTVPSPGATNKLAAPVGEGNGKQATVNDKKVATIAADTAASTTASNAATGSSEAPEVTVHPLTLAVVIAAAILYGAYEYRYDLANHIRQFRRNRAARQ